MGRRRKGRAINGVFLLDKPLGESSNMVLQKVRAMYGAVKAGHTGALDPLASGMLPICLGEATNFPVFTQCDKTYEVTALWVFVPLPRMLMGKWYRHYL